ncbi:LIGHT-HARVESTING COMPLEX-LIKE PROTEIN OHP2 CHLOROPLASTIC [Salix purpurea]|uniref:LIGHT-HARVESTING COMPLEX-LIKE PROTEIN OHP2 CHLOROPLASTIC n=1 Tax=Salix purpurea TaxID=77065 RepID=A0A9Q0QDU5_SALPP|nr:LIGHT-HARVESTING COMPLEX-LIKE PROTEIN OHP2 CHLOROPLASTIC [Salix purpurea]
MRVLFSKIHCPSFICFCKPSPSIYTPGPLKLENSPHVPSTAVSVADASSNDNHVLSDSIEVREGSVGVYGKQPESHNSPKSSLKTAAFDSKEVDKKKVQWIDFLGKELVEIREFESSCSICCCTGVGCCAKKLLLGKGREDPY